MWRNYSRLIWRLARWMRFIRGRTHCTRTFSGSYSHSWCCTSLPIVNTTTRLAQRPEASIGMRFWGTGEGCLEEHAEELDADAYATHYELAHLLHDDTKRKASMTLLGKEDTSEAVADEILLASFVMAIAALLYALPQRPFDPSQVRTQHHPPRAARINNVMNHIIDFCEKHHRSLTTWLTP